MRKLGTYVQVPFCQTKCTYCNFHTGVVASSRFAPYVATVCREIREHRELLRAAGVGWSGDADPKAHSQEWQCHEGVVDTVYIGGGTPSLLDAAHLQSILDAIRATFVAELVEVTLEADPETIEAEKAAAWVRAGINRVSFGLQSFVDKELIAAGRMHRRADIYRAMPILRAAGIRNISFDLIAGLPHQTKESWWRSLEELAGLGPEHVSVYLLEIDEGSRLGKELLQGGGKYSAAAVPSEDEMAEFYEMAQEALGAAGYHHYEISNWAKPGFESKHNLKYWRREPYLGFGAGAHSFSGTERWANAHDATGYVAAVQSGRLPVEQHETLTAESALEEELFLGLRQLEGIDVGRIEREYGVTLAGKFDPLALAGLVRRDGGMVRLAPERLSVSNEVFVELMR
jgi:oxygen-independent coproporphyrinogen-3 oxidase